MITEKNTETIMKPRTAIGFTVYKLISLILWIMFVGNVAIIAFNFPNFPEWYLGNDV